MQVENPTWCCDPSRYLLIELLHQEPTSSLCFIAASFTVNFSQLYIPTKEGENPRFHLSPVVDNSECARYQENSQSTADPAAPHLCGLCYQTFALSA